MYKDKDGKEIDLMTWADLMQDPHYRLVEKDEIDGITVATVWTGMDALRYDDKGSEHLDGYFATTTFKRGMFVSHQIDEIRHPTLKKAKEEHDKIVRELKMYDSPIKNVELQKLMEDKMIEICRELQPKIKENVEESPPLTLEEKSVSEEIQSRMSSIIMKYIEKDRRPLIDALDWILAVVANDEKNGLRCYQNAQNKGKND